MMDFYLIPLTEPCLQCIFWHPMESFEFLSFGVKTKLQVNFKTASRCCRLDYCHKSEILWQLPQSDIKIYIISIFLLLQMQVQLTSKKKPALQKTTQFLRRHNNIYTFKLKFSVINLAFQTDVQTAILLSRLYS